MTKIFGLSVFLVFCLILAIWARSYWRAELLTTGGTNNLHGAVAVAGQGWVVLVFNVDTTSYPRRYFFDIQGDEDIVDIILSKTFIQRAVSDYRYYMQHDTFLFVLGKTDHRIIAVGFPFLLAEVVLSLALFVCLKRIRSRSKTRPSFEVVDARSP